MRPALTTVEQQGRAAAAAYLMKHAGATALMVLDAGTDQPVGIITEADITHAVADGKDMNSVRIYDLMTTRPTVIKTTTNIRDAANLMTSGHFRHLPVVGDVGLVGIVDIADLCHALLEPGVSGDARARGQAFDVKAARLAGPPPGAGRQPRRGLTLLLLASIIVHSWPPRAPRTAGPRRCLRVLVRQVVAQLAQEPIRHRDDPVVAALALGEEQLPSPARTPAIFRRPSIWHRRRPARSIASTIAAYGVWCTGIAVGGTLWSRREGCRLRITTGWRRRLRAGRSRHGNDIGA
jgi:predicted transcriptional regulator